MDPELLECGGKDPYKLSKIYAINFSPSFPQRIYDPLPKYNIHWGKGNNQIFWRLLNSSYELTLIPGDSNLTVAPQSEQNLINRILEPILWLFPRFQNVQLQQTYIAPGRTATIVLWPVWSEAYYDEKGQMEAIRTASTQENSKSKQYAFLEELQNLVPPSRT